MMDFDEVLADAFDGIGSTATYTPPAGAAKDIKVIASLGEEVQDPQGIRTLRSGAVFEVRRAALPAPVRGASLVVGEKQFTVKAALPAPEDPDNLLWLLECVPA